MLRRPTLPSPGKCPCEVAIAVLSALGARHAARMHRRRAARRPGAWTPWDWEVHMAEEERWFIPLVARIDREAARQMLLDHAVFRSELAEHGEIVSHGRIAAHSKLEDEIAARMVELGLVELGSDA